MFWHSIFGVAVFFSILFALVPNLLWFVAWCIGLLFGYHLPYAPFGWSTVALVVIVWTFFLCGHFIGRFRSKVTHVDSIDRPGHLEKLLSGSRTPQTEEECVWLENMRKLEAEGKVIDIPSGTF